MKRFVYADADESSTRTLPLPLACQVRHASRYLSIFCSQTQALARLTEALLLEMPANAGFLRDDGAGSGPVGTRMS